MSAPSGKPSPEGTRSSDVKKAMAIQDADTGENASVVPISVESSSPSERSRSDKREVAPKASQVAVLPLNDAARFLHRGYDYHASRKGMPTGSNHMQPSHAEVYFQESHVQNTLNLNQTQHNQLHVNTHNPAITQLVEQVAEARHRESMANTEGMFNMMVSEMNRRFEAEEHTASQRMSQMMTLAERREGQFREELLQQGEEYKRVRWECQIIQCHKGFADECIENPLRETGWST